MLIIHSLRVLVYFKISKYVHSSFRTPVLLHTQIVYHSIKQRSSLANPTVVTKLRFIRIKQNLFTSADEERRRLITRKPS